MGKRSQHSTWHKQRRWARKYAPQKKMRQGMPSYTQLQGIFQPFLESIVVCDQEGKILQFNAAALTLFEIPNEALYRGTSFQQFLHTFHQSDDLHQSDFPEIWLTALIMHATAEPYPPAKMLLRMPSGREVSVNLRSAPLLDKEEHVVGTVVVFQEITYPYQKWLHLQQVHETVVALSDAIAALPVYDPQMLPEEPLLLSPPVSSVAQPLVDMIRQVLDARRVVLLAVGSAGQLSYIADSGLTAEQVQVLQTSKEIVASMFFDEQVLARLSAHQEVFLSSQDLPKRPSFAPVFGSEHLLILPLFLEEQFAGVLTVFKSGSSSGYMPEETELAKILVAEIELLVECLGILRERIESGTRALVQQEVGHLSSDFLALASHEIKTPLTGIIGNIQLAQRRLYRLKRQIREQTEGESEHIGKIEEPLASAIESAHLQQRIINEMIDTLHTHTKPLEVRMKEENLLTLLQDTLAKLQRSVPERRIELNLPSTARTVLIRADGQQIIQVLSNYLVNTLCHSSTKHTVTVRLMVTDTVALILVHDGELGIAAEEEQPLWERLSQMSGATLQHNLDVNLGTGFYLCQMLIKQHHGQVGVQSHPSHGTTFWLTLPIKALLQE